MKIVTASGKRSIVMSRKEWEAIGKKAGWTRKDPVKNADDNGDDDDDGGDEGGESAVICPYCSSDDTVREGNIPGEVTCKSCSEKWMKKVK